MGWKSTMDITRADALVEICRLLNTASDEQICEVLEELTPDWPFNFRAVYDYSEDDRLNYRNRGLEIS